jgi:hypothetical protein
MKTNEWLAYLLDEHRADFVGVLRGEAAARYGLIPDAALEAWTTALRDDLDAEQQERSLAELHSLAVLASQPDAALVAFWDVVERLITGYIASEPDMVGGAKRLAHLRLSTFGAVVRAYLRET